MSMHGDIERQAAVLAAAATCGMLAACTTFVPGRDTDVNMKPTFLGAVSRVVYDGSSGDLLTAGLGKSGLAASAPTFANPAAPTAAELRRSAIYNNYRAIVDVNARGGYGTLYGPNVDRSGKDALGEGKVAGVEYIAYADDGTGTKNVTLMVQIPNGWDRNRPCIVTGTSSGSRGVYGAIGSSGEWGLKRGCAVAYADKGTGLGVHDLASDTVHLQNGTRASATAAGTASSFTSLSGAALAAFNAASPNRVAVKHAHSQQNPERDWGLDTLNAIRFAIWSLNEEKGDKNAASSTRRTYSASNTIVIASSVSNGGGAAIAAAEQDSEGLIDGVAVSEPNIALAMNPNLRIQRGSRTLPGVGRPLYDYFTYASLLQPCAALSPRAAGSPGANFIPAPRATNRCTSLKAKGILAASTTAQQADEALDKLIAYGWEAESNRLHASHYALATTSITMTYSNTYGRFGVADHLCGLSFAGVDANSRPAPIAAVALAQSFATGNGIPPTAGIQIINNLDPSGPLAEAASTSPSSGIADANLDGALCQRNLWTGSDANAAKVKAGVAQTLRNGNLRGKPTIIVHGRADTLVPVNFTSRAYFGLNKTVEGAASRLTYVEVTNAQHFDTFIDNAALQGYDAMFVPLHYYFNQALDRMYAHLTAGAALPPSQVVRTTPRGGTPGQAPQIAAANVPSIAQEPPAADRITFSNNTVAVPD